MAFKRFIKISDDGTVLTDMATVIDFPPETGWIKIPREKHHMLGLDTHRLKYDQDLGLLEKTRIRLSVSSYTWPADGVTPLHISVRGENLEDGEMVTVDINGDRYQIHKKDDIVLTSDEPGNFVVRVADPNYSAIPSEVVLTAEQEDENA